MKTITISFLIASIQRMIKKSFISLGNETKIINKNLKIKMIQVLDAQIEVLITPRIFTVPICNGVSNRHLEEYLNYLPYV